MRLKAWISLILACALMAGVLAGCGGSAPAMGRYAEEPLALPESAGRVLFTAMRDYKLIYYTQAEDGTILRCVEPTPVLSSNAESNPVAWLNDLLGEDGMVSSLSEAPGGTVYAIVSEIAADGAGKTMLYRSVDGQTAKVIEMPDWSEGSGVFVQRATGGPQGGGGPQGPGGPQTSSGAYTSGGPQGDARARFDGLNPRSVAALDDGFLVSYIQGNIIQYDAMGKKLREYNLSGGMGGPGGGMVRLGGGAALAVFENTLALADTGAREIVLYDLTTGEKTGAKFPCAALDSSTYIGLDKDGPLLGDSTGVYRFGESKAMPNGGPVWEMVVDGGLTSLVMPTLSIEGLFDDGAGTYYAFLSGDRLTGDAGTRLVRFAFDESLPAEPSATLEVFSLSDSATVRMAIGAFQRANPDVRVHLQVGLEEGGAATTEDVVRALNTSLIAQKGPDVLVLDGLPIQSYIRQGVLKDITNLANSLAASESLMQNLTGAYAKDGKIYGLPALFGLPAMVGDTTALSQFTSLEALVQAVKARGAETPVLLRAPDGLYAEDAEALLASYEIYYDTCSSGFTNANGSLDEEALAAFLADMLALSDALKAVTPQVTDQRRMGMAMFISNGRQSAMMDPRAVMDVAQGNALSCVQQVSGMGPLMMVFTSLGDDETMSLQSLFGQNQFYPRCGVGVVSASKQQRQAEDFVALLLSAEVQDSNLFDGLPVNKASLQKTLDDLKGMTFDVRGTEINDMGFIALCDSLEIPLFTDETVKAAVAARMKSLLDGSATPEEAAAQIVADTKLYLAE